MAKRGLNATRTKQRQQMVDSAVTVTYLDNGKGNENSKFQHRRWQMVVDDSCVLLKSARASMRIGCESILWALTYEIERANFSTVSFLKGILPYQKNLFFSFKSPLLFASPFRLAFGSYQLCVWRSYGSTSLSDEAVKYILNSSKGTLLLSSSLSLVTVHHHTVVKIPDSRLVTRSGPLKDGDVKG
jgi:hypothetical protein